VPSIDERTSDAAALQPQNRFVTECRKDWRSARIRRLLGSVWPAELDAISHEQDRGRMLPDGFEPPGFGARV
jgi:hypothetical protein